MWTVFLILFGFLSNISGLSEEPVQDLYKSDDGIINLNVDNYEKEIFGSQTGWFVEFYNSFCGYCIGFAPTFIKFAKDITAWKSVVRVAAMNCADPKNTATCRKLEAVRYPQIMYFKSNSGVDELGEKWQKRPDATDEMVDEMRRGVVDFVAGEKNRPSGWPALEPISQVTVTSVWETVPDATKAIAIVAEEPDSHVGREVVLDTTSLRKWGISVAFVHSNNSELVQLLRVTSFPSLVVVSRNGDQVLVDGKNATRRGFVAHLRALAGEGRSSSQEGAAAAARQQQQQESVLTEPELAAVDAERVYLLDVENALSQSLRVEVLLRGEIEGEALAALRNYVRVLVKYLPGRPAVKKMLRSLLVWVEERPIQITSEDLSIFYATVDAREDVALPKLRSWMGCRGSSSKYRGFTCGLWTVFHLMTVQHRQLLKPDPRNDKMEVLDAILGYVTHFFSCKFCAEHYRKMASKMAEEVRTVDDGAIWLWDAHNRVNERLKGDASEDPQHPKVQFPVPDSCPTCRIHHPRGAAPAFDETQVLKYLENRYSLDNVDLTGVESGARLEKMIDRMVPNPSEKKRVLERKHNFQLLKRHRDEEPPSEDRLEVGTDKVRIRIDSSRKRIPSGWDFNAMDTSMCIFLYVLSALMLCLAYFVFAVKRKFRRKAYYLMS